MTSCPVCFENNEKQMIALRGCSHEICHPCLKQWFDACERTGQELPTCPKCRVSVQADETTDILGHIFSPAGSSGVAQGETAEMDEFTQQLLSETARACGNCGVWIVKEDGCDMMQCVCGYRFCFGCGMAGGQDCGCTPAHHVFYDNVTEQNATGAPVHVATPEELDDFRLYLERIKIRVLMEDVLLQVTNRECLHCRHQLGPDPWFTASFNLGLGWSFQTVSNDCVCDRLTFLDNVALRGNTEEATGVELISAAEELRNLRSFLRARQAKHSLIRQMRYEYIRCGDDKVWGIFWQSSSQAGDVAIVDSIDHELQTLRQMLQARKSKRKSLSEIEPYCYQRSHLFRVWNIVASSRKTAGVHCGVPTNDEIKFLHPFLQLHRTWMEVHKQIWGHNWQLEYLDAGDY